MDLILQFIVNGLLIGGVYALVALSIVIIYKATQIFNFAVGTLMVVGMFSAWSLMEIGVPLWISIASGVIVSTLLGFLIERLALRPLIGQPMFSAVLATFAVSFILSGIVLLLWRGSASEYPMQLPGGHVQIGSITMAKELVWIFAVTILVILLVIFTFQYTKIGLGMRGTAEDQSLARARGVPVGAIFGISWMLASAVCGVGGIFLAYRLGITTDVSTIGLGAFPAVLLGGIDSIHGALIGGLIIGLTVSLTSGLVSQAAATIAPFIVLLIVLFVKTEGLFGLKRIERI